jgi:hypothetical protein
LISELEKKVSALKHATQGIHDEVEADNKMLGGMVRAPAVAGLRGFGGCWHAQNCLLTSMWL